MISSLSRVALLSTLALGGGSSLHALHRNEWNISSLSGVRLGRSMYTVAVIIADYKLTLYNGAAKCTPSEDPRYDAIKSRVHERCAQRLKQLCCLNGGCFIKVGQHLGSLEYLLPIEYVKTLQILQSNAPQSPLSDIKYVIKEELGKDVDEIFSSFDDTPIGTASLAQVHRATLRSNGKVVAVKVQHRRVRSNTWIDINTMHLMVCLGELLFPEFRFRWLSEETRKNLPIELDFYNEGLNCDRVKKLFKRFEFLKVPSIEWEYTTKRVLTMEYCAGGQVNDAAYMRKHKIDVSKVVNNLTSLYNEMIFVEGYVHCDPHPGNVLVHRDTEGDGKTKIVLLDHGLYQTLSSEFRLDYCRLWRSLLERDTEAIHHYATRLGTGELDHLLAGMVTSRSWNSVCNGIDKISISDEEDRIVQEEAAQSIGDITDVLSRVPREMLLIFKTNDLVRGIETALKCRSTARSFLQTSKCCIRAMYQHDLCTAQGLWQRALVHLRSQAALFQLGLASVAIELKCWWARVSEAGTGTAAASAATFSSQGQTEVAVAS